MPGTFIVKPIEANLTHNTDLLTKMSPYCAISVGQNKVQGQICSKGGKNPHWTDAIPVPATGESKVLVEVMDKDKITKDDNIGSFFLDLNEVQASGHLSKWYPLTYKNKPAGQILIDTSYEGQSGVNYGQGQSLYQQGQLYGGVAGAAGTQGSYYSGSSGSSSKYAGSYYSGISSQNQYYGQERYHTAKVTQEKYVGTTDTSSNRATVWTEQHQTVEPHSFIKEVEVVETRPCLKEIEVMEPHKVLKDVQYTQAVPVRKQIEIADPQVVMKEIEVMEPRLVTKTIQVIENVPVKRQVEVVEMRNLLQEVETLEPQTLHKQVQVTEYMPVKKQVEITEPFTLRKAVEFVEPVIKTQIITKEEQPVVIIDEKVTTTVGPASVIGMSTEYGYIQQQFSTLSISEKQRLAGLQRWIGYESIFGGLTEQERLYEQYRLSRLNEQEWLRERERLLKVNQQDRLFYQRNIFNQFNQINQLNQINQAGNLSTGQISQYGNVSTAPVSQYVNVSTVPVSQYGNISSAQVNQYGNLSSAQVNQYGNVSSAQSTQYKNVSSQYKNVSSSSNQVYSQSTKYSSKFHY